MKKQLILASTLLLTFSVQAEYGSGIIVGYDNFNIDANRSAADNALGDSEAGDTPGYTLSGWSTDTLNQDYDYGLRVHYNKRTSHDNIVAGEVLDDSFAGGLALEGSLIRELDDKTSMSVGLNYAISSEKESANSATEEIDRKILGIDVSIAKEWGNTIGMATLGAYNNRSADKDSGGSTQRYTNDVKYLSLAAQHKVDDTYSIGGSYVRFGGSIDQEGSVTEKGKDTDIWSLYGQYNQNDYNLRVGYKDYYFDDKDDSEHLQADAAFVELSYKFGSTSARSYMLINEKPDYLTYDGINSGQLE